MAHVKSISLHLVGMILQNATMLITGIYVARTIGAADYGTSTILRSLFQIVAVMAPLGLELALQKYIGEHSARVAATRMVSNRLRAVAFCLGLAILVALASGGAAWMNTSYYNIASFDWLLIVTFAALPFQSDITILGGIYRGRFNPVPQILIGFYILPLLRLAIIVLLLTLGYGLMGVVIATTVSLAASFVLLNLHYYFRQDRQIIECAPPDPVSWRETLSLLEPSIWMAASLFLYGSIRSIDVIVLGFFRTTKEVGEYGATSTIAQFVQFFPHAVSQTLGPTIASLFAARNLPAVCAALDRNLRTAALLAAPIFAGVAVWGAGMDVLFGRSFQFSANVSFGLALGYYVSGVTGATGFALSMTGHHRAESIILLVGNAVALFGCLALVPPFGGLGAAAASCLAYVAINIARTLLARRIIGATPGTLSDLLPAISALLLALAVFHAFEAWMGHELVTFFLSGIVYILLYGVLAWRFFLKSDEKSFIHARLQKITALLTRRHSSPRDTGGN